MSAVVQMLLKPDALHAMAFEKYEGEDLAVGAFAAFAGLWMFLIVLTWVVTFVALWMAWQCKDKTVNLITAWYNPFLYIVLRLLLKKA